MGPAEIITATVGAIAIGSALVGVGRWVGGLEARGASAKLEADVEQLKAWRSEHRSEHKQLAGRVDEGRDVALQVRGKLESIHDEEEKR